MAVKVYIVYVSAAFVYRVCAGLCGFDNFLVVMDRHIELSECTVR